MDLCIKYQRAVLHDQRAITCDGCGEWNHIKCGTDISVKKYNQAVKRGTYWMFDCGEGSQIQLMRSSVRAGKISKIFVSHLHGDHIFGLPGLICTVSKNFSPDRAPLELFGPVGLRKFLRVSLSLSRSLLGFNYIVHELMPLQQQYPQNWQDWIVDHEANEDLHPNETLGRTIHADDSNVWHVYDDNQLTVKASLLSHWVPSFGYVIEEKNVHGKLDANLLLSRGIQPGPDYAKIKAGEAITAPSGEIIQPEEVLGPSKPGRKVVILGDTSDSEHMTALCQNADVLVHEATLEDDLEANALEKGHSTAGMAGRFAKAVGARQLVLTHFSQRYKPISSDLKEGENSVEKLLSQAIAAFGSEHVVAAEDFSTLPVTRHKKT